MRLFNTFTLIRKLKIAVWFEMRAPKTKARVYAQKEEGWIALY